LKKLGLSKYHGSPNQVDSKGSEIMLNLDSWRTDIGYYDMEHSVLNNCMTGVETESFQDAKTYGAKMDKIAKSIFACIFKEIEKVER